MAKHLKNMLLFSALLSCAVAGPVLSQADTVPRSATRSPSTAEHEGYVFLYFKNNDERLYIALSNGNDILSFTEANNGNPVLTSTYGDKGLRDPYIIRSQDGSGFHILATDLCVGCGTSWYDASRFGSRYLEIWDTPDLINFSEQHHTLVSPESYGMSWAPEAHWDAELGTYFTHWASAIYDNETNPNREDSVPIKMVYALTDDFKTFSEPKVWQDYPPEGRIDASVFRDDDGTYYRFTKGTIDGCADFVQESSSTLTAPQEDWKLITSCIGRNLGTDDLEGPIVFKTNPGDVGGERYILLGDMIIDAATNRGYVPLESTDLSSGQWTLKDTNSYPFHPRHGVVTPVTAGELEALRVAYNVTSE
ncbi:glycosyl hydrolases family 43 domain-containing protein [Sarocladium implicatum]|nr:glycosyl hydrolases family 43 domain-containing protein [Sarocladium implicatum]